MERMEFDETRWSCPQNSDKKCAQNSARGGGWGPGVVWVPEDGVLGSGGVLGMGF